MTAVVPSSSVSGVFEADTIDYDATRALIRARGPLDGAGVVHLCERLESHLRGGHRLVRLDVGQVTVSAPETLGMIGRMHRRFLAARGTLVLVCTPASFLQMVRRAGLGGELFCVEPTAWDRQPGSAV